MLIDKSKNILMKCASQIGGEVTIPEGVELIASGAFSNNREFLATGLPKALPGTIGKHTPNGKPLMLNHRVNEDR